MHSNMLFNNLKDYFCICKDKVTELISLYEGNFWKIISKYHHTMVNNSTKPYIRHDINSPKKRLRLFSESDNSISSDKDNIGKLPKSRFSKLNLKRRGTYLEHHKSLAQKLFKWHPNSNESAANLSDRSELNLSSKDLEPSKEKKI